MLEKARRVQAILFDKTGTLTMGRPSVQACVGPDESRLLWAAACCEASSEHPLAQAVVSAHRSRENHIPVVATSEFETIAGEGLRCRLSGLERQQVLVGNFRLMNHFNVPVSDEMMRQATTQADAARTVIFVAGKKVVFVFTCLYSLDFKIILFRKQHLVGVDCNC